jgi:UDP-N-acetyl-D-mannosaminuronic acid dehydrogenase
MAEDTDEMASSGRAKRGNVTEAAEIVIIGGCGHVGLPLGLALARSGKKVVALDIDANKVAQVNAGRMPFLDRGADAVLEKMVASGAFRASTEEALLSSADIVVTVIGTPVDEYLNPRLYLITDLIMGYLSRLRAGQLFLLRSTVYPGTTERVEALLREKGLELDVAYCPERVAEGQALEEITSLPQIVAGCSERAQKRAEDLFRLVTPDVIAVSPVAAELTKLFNNAWRYSQFALANQFFMMANDHGVDFYEIYRAMTERYPRAQGFPKAGLAAGPCLFKDTIQLGAYNNNAFFMNQAAVMINEGFPNYMVQRIARRFDLRKSVAGILGMTFKADSDDPRDSLAFKLRKILQIECKDVLCTDPFLKDPALLPLPEVLRRSDILFIGSPHTAYRKLDFGKTPVVDVWNMTPGRLKTL